MDTKNCPIGNALPFSTESGNKYIYDNYSGLTFPEEPSVLEKLTGSGDYLGIDRTSAPLPDKIDEQMVKTYIAEHSYNQLTLEMTADCNFRCRYCIYGEHYPETRTLSHQKMDFETAKKAVDYYMAGVLGKFRKNPNAYPTIGFYGGEPLLQFPVIRQVVEYISEKYTCFPKISYTITTNASLLTDEIADFFVEHDFSIIVSLDGDRENHDRNRVTADRRVRSTGWWGTSIGSARDILTMTGLA